MEQALAYAPKDARLVMEYQQLLKNMDVSPARRLAVYERLGATAFERDDCYLDSVELLCMEGRYCEAINRAAARHFHIYEGGEGRLTKLHSWMHTLCANQLADAQPGEAERIYRAGAIIPKTYGEAKTFCNQEAHVYYYLGLLLERQGRRKEAAASFEEASVYKAAVSEVSVFRALALRRMSRFGEAKRVLDEMLEAAQDKIDNGDRRSYYGVGSPSPMPFEYNIEKYNHTDGYILRAYAMWGLGRTTEAWDSLRKAEALTPWDFRIHAFRQMADYEENGNAD